MAKKKLFGKLGKKIGNAVSDAQRKAKALADKAKAQAKELQRKADEAKRNVAKAVGDEARRKAKQIADLAHKASENARKNAQNAGKKVKKGLKNLSGKIRKAYKKLLRKATLGVVYTAIRTNASGLAIRLYPAIATSTEIKNKKLKTSFVPTSKSAYAKVLAKWKNLGGKEAKLNEAITQGSKITIKKYGFDGDVQMYSLPFPNNNSSNFLQSPKIYSGCNGEMSYSSADGDDLSSEQLTAEEQAELDAYGLDEAESGEKASLGKAFIAWIRGLFSKNDSPYEDGTLVDDASFPELTAEDLALLGGIDPTNSDPEEEGESDVDYKKSDDDEDEESEDDEDEIWGMNKYVVYGGGAVLVAGVAFGIFKLVQHLKK